MFLFIIIGLIDYESFNPEQVNKLHFWQFNQLFYWFLLKFMSNMLKWFEWWDEQSVNWSPRAEIDQWMKQEVEKVKTYPPNRTSCLCVNWTTAGSRRRRSERDRKMWTDSFSWSLFLFYGKWKFQLNFKSQLVVNTRTRICFHRFYKVLDSKKEKVNEDRGDVSTENQAEAVETERV